MSRKQVISVLAVILALVVLAVGCAQGNTQSSTQGNSTQASTAAQSNSTTAAPQEKPVNLRYAYIGDPPVDEAEVMKAVNEKLAADGVGVTIEPVYIPDAEYVNKLVMIAASKEDMDLCWTMPTNMPDLVSKNALAPLTKSLNTYGKNLLDAVTKAQWKEVTINGEIYGTPGLMPSASVDMTIQIRTDLMKKYGVDKVETVADLTKFAEAYKKDHPDGLAFYSMSGRELYREYGEIFEPYGKEMKSPVCVLLSDPTMTVQNFYKTDTFLKSVATIRDWSSKGYYFNEKPAKSLLPKLAQGLVGACWCVLNTHERIGTFNSNKTDPNASIDTVMLRPNDPKPLKNFGADNMSVFAQTKSVDGAVKFIQWLRGSQEAYDLMSYGIKGVNYNLDGDSVSYEGIAADKLYNPQNWMWSDIRYMRFDKTLGPDYKNKLLHWNDNAVTYPFTGFVLDTKPIINEISQIKALMEQYVPMMQNYKIDFQKTYKEFLTKLDQAGEQKVIDEVAKQMKAYEDSNK